MKYARGKIKLNIELKPSGYEKDFEKNVLDIIRKNHAQRYCIISSMKYECLENVKKLDPDMETLYITSVSFGNFTVMDAADGYSVEASMLTQSYCQPRTPCRQRSVCLDGKFRGFDGKCIENGRRCHHYR